MGPRMHTYACQVDLRTCHCHEDNLGIAAHAFSNLAILAAAAIRTRLAACAPLRACAAPASQ